MTPARTPGRRSYAAATLSIVFLSLVAGFAFAGTGREDAPQSAAAEEAASVAAVRIALGGSSVTTSTPEIARTAEPQPLIAGAEHVGVPNTATRVRVPSIGIDAEVRSVGYVFEQGALRYDTPRHEAGHYAGRAAPGEPGNAVIAGHVSTRGGEAVFEHLPEVGVGDLIEVFRGEELHRYEVTELRRVDPDQTSVMAATSEATLTLITCFPDQNYADRLVVVAKLV